MLFSSDQINLHNGINKRGKVVYNADVILKPAELVSMLKKNIPMSLERRSILESERISMINERKEVRRQFHHSKKKPAEFNKGLPEELPPAEEEEEKFDENNPPAYFDVKLVSNSHLKWIPEVDEDGKETIVKSFNHVAVWIWFPKQNVIRPVRVCNCIMAFAKFQRMVIISYITREITYEKLPPLNIPRMFKNGGNLIGAALGDILPDELEEFSSDKKTIGPIYLL